MTASPDYLRTCFNESMADQQHLPHDVYEWGVQASGSDFGARLEQITSALSLCHGKDDRFYALIQDLKDMGRAAVDSASETGDFYKHYAFAKATNTFWLKNKNSPIRTAVSSLASDERGYLYAQQKKDDVRRKTKTFKAF